MTDETDGTQELQLRAIRMCQVIKKYSGQKAGNADQG